jgi:hypothetical protein
MTDSEMKFTKRQTAQISKLVIALRLLRRRGLVGLSLAVVLISSLVAVRVEAQDEKTDKTVAVKPTAENTAKAEQVLTRAIEVIGGSNYLNVKTVLGRGFYTAFLDGISQVPTRFVDYIVFPDRERTEFVASGIRTIQTNAGETGWFYDGATKTLVDMKPDQIADFKRGMRTSMENLLHGWWRKEGATLSYIGRREAGLAKRNEVVRITYPEGFWIEYEFGAKDGLPAKMIYKRTKKKPDSEETEEITEEDRLAKPITISGVLAPWVIDHYINGVQASRINYESIEYNQPLADSFFAKPATIKGLK